MRINQGGGSRKAAPLSSLNVRLEALRRKLEAAKQKAEEAKRKAAEAQKQAALAQQKAEQARTKASESKGKVEPKVQKKLETEATKLEKTSQTAQKDAIDAANRALELQRTANEVAKASGEKEPYALANQVKDVFDAGSLSAKDQVTLFGAETVVTPEQSAAVDAGKIGLMMQKNPEKAAKMLADQLEASDDPAYQQALIKVASSWMLPALGKDLSNEKVVEHLVRASETAGPEGSKLIADGVAKGIPEGSLPEGLEKSLDTAFSVHLAEALHEAGKPLAAKEIVKAQTALLEEVREDFGKAAEKVDALNQKLALLVAGFGPAMTDEQKQSAIEAFKKQHAKEYEAFEKAGAKLARMVDGASEALVSDALPKDAWYTKQLREEATAALQELPRLGETEAGQEVIATALEKQAKGEESFLNRMPEVALVAKDATKFLGDVSNVVVKSIANKVLTLSAAGRPGDAHALFAGLQQNAKLFGASVESMTKISGALEDVLNGKPNALATLEGELRKSAGGVPGAPYNARGGQALRGLALVVTLAGNADAWKNFSEAELKDKVKTVATSFGLGFDGGMLALDVLGKAEKLGAVTKLLGRGSGLATGIIAITDGITAVKAFQDGDYAQGAVSTASAIGGVILGTTVFTAAAGVQVVPIAGQIAGVILVAGGLIGQLALKNHNAKMDEKDAQAFLEAAGIPENVAKELSDLDKHGRNIGPFIVQVAPLLDMTPQEFLKHLGTLSKDELDGVVTMAKSLDQDAQLQIQKDSKRDEEIDGLGKAAWLFQPESLEGAAEWLRETGLVG